MTAKEFLKKDGNEIMRKIEEIRKVSSKKKEMKIEEAKEGKEVEQERCNTNLKVGILRRQDDDDVIQTEDVL